MTDRQFEKFQRLNEEWYYILNHFFHQSIEFEENDFKTKLLYKVPHVLESDIKLTSYYGFLALAFKDEKSLDKFIKIAGIQSTVEISKVKGLDIEIPKTKWQSVIWKIPSQIFINRKSSTHPNIISFYDLTNFKSVRETIKNRLLVLESVSKIIVEYKISQLI